MACFTVCGWSATRNSLDAERQIGLDLLHGLFDVPAEDQDVAAFPHRDCEADRGLSIDTEHRLRRIGKRAANRGDIPKPDQPPVHDEGHILEVFLEVERARRSKRESLVSRLNGPGRNDDILRFERCGESGPVDSQSRKLLGRELYEDFLILRAEEFDLRYVRHLQEFRANILDSIPKLAMAEAVGGEAVDNSVGIAELIVEARADDASRKRVAHIGHAFADVIPDIGNFCGRRLTLQRDENRGAPRLRVTLDVIEARRFLKRRAQGARSPVSASHSGPRPARPQTRPWCGR